MWHRVIAGVYLLARVLECFTMRGRVGGRGEGEWVTWGVGGGA